MFCKLLSLPVSLISSFLTVGAFLPQCPIKSLQTFLPKCVLLLQNIVQGVQVGWLALQDECSDFSEQLANQDVMFGLEILGRSLNAFHAQSSTMEISKPEILSPLDANRQGVTISLTLPLWDS